MVELPQFLRKLIPIHTSKAGVLETASKFLKIKSMPRFFDGKLFVKVAEQWIGWSMVDFFGEIWKPEMEGGFRLSDVPIIQCDYAIHNLQVKQNDQI